MERQTEGETEIYTRREREDLHSEKDRESHIWRHRGIPRERDTHTHIRERQRQRYTERESDRDTGRYI
jgi:hypothetical protein